MMRISSTSFIVGFPSPSSPEPRLFRHPVRAAYATARPPPVLNLLPVHLQGLPIRVEWDLEVEVMCRWTVIVLELNSLMDLSFL